MPRLFSVLALAAAFIPAVFANETDCNVSRIDLFSESSREPIVSTNTDFETTRYDATIVSGTASESVRFGIAQNPNSQARYTIRLNDQIVNSSPAGADSDAIVASGFNVGCGALNHVLVEVNEMKNAKQRYDSCAFKYEIYYTEQC
jgi:hypothetical protein